MNYKSNNLDHIYGDSKMLHIKSEHDFFSSILVMLNFNGKWSQIRISFIYYFNLGGSYKILTLDMLPILR